MSSPGSLLVKRARVLRHAHRGSGLSNILEARVPQLLPLPDDDPEPSTTRTARPTPTDDDDDDDDDDDSTLTPTVTRSSSSIPLPPSFTRGPPASPTSTPTPTLTRTLTETPDSSTSSSVIRTSESSPSTSSVAPTTSSGDSLSTSSSVSVTRTVTTPTSQLTSSQTTERVTRTVSSPSATSGSALDSTSSATSTAEPSSGTSTASIFGIVAASVVGAIVVVSLVMFFVRRWRRKQDEYDSDAFRRQSVILRDEETTLQRGNSTGRGGPRPPTMIERHNQNVAAFAAPNTYQSMGNPYGYTNQYNDVSSQSYGSFSPGMHVPNPAVSPPPAAQYAYTSPYYNPMTQSPVGSPTTVGSYGGGAYDAQGNIVRVPSNAAASTLSRHNSVPAPQQTEDYDYLTRASVTPFQAAQYEAISKQLNIPPPQPLQQVSEVDEAVEPRYASGPKVVNSTDIDSGPLVSPFEDVQPNTAHNSIAAIAAVGAVGAVTAVSDGKDTTLEPSRPSSEFHSMESASRVTSLPPSLPEISMSNSSFSPVVSTFPVSPSPRKGSFDVHGGRASPKVDLPPLSPVSSSPQRAQFVDGLEARAHDGHETPVEIGFIGKDQTVTKDIQPAVQAKPEVVSKPEPARGEASKRPETVYSDEDAYGGF